MLLPEAGIEIDLGVEALTAETRWLTRPWAGALIVLFVNTAAYSAEIFYGALRAVPKGDIEAAEAYGMTGWTRLRRFTWPTTLRLAWPAYTNEAIFLFHATTPVFFSGFPTWRQQGDALSYANYFADKAFNPFVHYPILAFYFIVMTLVIISVFAAANRHLNRHLPRSARARIKLRLNLIRYVMTLEEIRTRYPDAESFTFGDNAKLCGDLITAVRAGVKTATCGALRDFGDGGEAMPVVGRIDIALNWDGTPALLIETTSVEITRFDEVDDAFALAEGENNSLDGWRRDHTDYFRRNGGFAPDMALVCERFRMVRDLGRDPI